MFFWSFDTPSVPPLVKVVDSGWEQEPENPHEKKKGTILVGDGLFATDPKKKSVRLHSPIRMSEDLRFQLPPNSEVST